MNSLDNDYLGVARAILLNGTKKKDRTGTGTKSLFGNFINFDMSVGFPLLTTKKVYWKGVVEELKWFLKGDVYAKTLSDKGVKIWDKDAERNGRDDTYLGKIYGYQWRKKSRYGVQKDQIKLLMEGIRNNPDSRRHLVNSWDVMELDDMVLPPCHYAFQCYVNDDKLDLMWHQRSADWFLGVPFNFASYGLLLSLLAYELDLKPGVLSASFGDTHIYSNHFDQMKEQIDRYPYYLPTLKINSSDILKGEFDIKLEDYFYHPAIKGELST
mgnify:FL=1